MAKLPLVIDEDLVDLIEAPGPRVSDRLNWLKGELGRIIRQRYAAEADAIVAPCPIDDRFDDEPHEFEISLEGETVRLKCARWHHDERAILEAILEELNVK